MYNKNETCCFTGHRDIPSALRQKIDHALKNEIISAYGLGIRTFIAGGAIGFDMMAAQAVLSLKNSYPDITLTLAIPCRDHDAKWSNSAKSEFAEIKKNADEITYVSESYHQGCMFKRNRYMIDRSCICISYCTRSTGGTRYTVDYALSSGIELREISSRL